MSKNCTRKLRYHTDSKFLLSLSHYETWNGIHGRTAAADEAKNAAYKWLGEVLSLVAATRGCEMSFSTHQHPCGCFTARVREYGEELTFQPPNVYHELPCKGNNFPARRYV